MIDAEYIKALKYYDGMLFKLKETGYAFGLVKLPKRSYLISIIMLVGSAIFESRVNTNFGLPLICIIICHGMRYSRQVHISVLIACMNYEHDHMLESRDEKWDLLNRNLDTEILDKEKVALNHIVTSVSCIAVFVITYLIFRQ